ncbi:hypothetical protein [Parafrigoribacterium soli]|uniref:hypothetical protein n=1 Tax=Parafrigoribacterium soli TaxID=3144663 RepID=UPI0032EC43FF
MTKNSGSGKVHPTEVDAEWSIVTDNDGAPLLQISTFGSDARASLPKVSQTIQLDAAMAGLLQKALTTTFGTDIT